MQSSLTIIVQFYTSIHNIIYDSSVSSVGLHLELSLGLMPCSWPQSWGSGPWSWHQEFSHW